MKKKPTTSDLEPSKLAEILNVCSEAQSPDADLSEDQRKAEMLQDRLSETLLSGSLKDSPLRKELHHLCCIAGIASGEPIRNLLINPETDMELIQKIKEHGKRLSQVTSSGVEHETANVIYYAAIAHALAYNDDKITQFSYEELDNSFTVFTNTDWISSDLIRLFEKAATYCREKGR